MEQILVIGSCGAGKSTFSLRLAKKLQLKVIHLDQQYWQSGWKRSEKKAWKNKIEKIIAEKGCVIDGNYKSTLDLRLKSATKVIWLDFSRWSCLVGVIRRRLLLDRVDRLDGCPERLTFRLLKWVLWDFPRNNRKQIAIKLKKFKGEVFVLNNRKEKDEFLQKIKSK